MITPSTLLRKVFAGGRLQRKLEAYSRTGALHARKGFTLAEVLLASTIFTIVSLIGVTVFINVTRIQRRIYLENAIYEDGRFMMERIAREIRQNAIDYEEYYNKLVEEKQYGESFGCYATRFYNPGTDGPGANFSRLGAYCSNPPLGNPQLNPGCVINKRTLDINTGTNPYSGISMPDNDPDDANAMCNLKFPPPSGACAMDLTLFDRDQLYLIDSKGKQKTFISLKEVNASPSENALSMARIQGEDANTDDIVETWVDTGTPNFYCAPGFDCTPGLFPTPELEDGLTNGTVPATRYVGFVPLSPLRTNITSLHFYVSPLEDPRKAFAETDPADGIQQQPHVTVVMTLQPAASEQSGFAGDLPTVTLQTTVSSRVYNEVKSYMGNGSCASY